MGERLQAGHATWAREHATLVSNTRPSRPPMLWRMDALVETLDGLIIENGGPNA